MSNIDPNGNEWWFTCQVSDPTDLYRLLLCGWYGELCSDEGEAPVFEVCVGTTGVFQVIRVV